MTTISRILEHLEWIGSETMPWIMSIVWLVGGISMIFNRKYQQLGHPRFWSRDPKPNNWLRQTIVVVAGLCAVLIGGAVLAYQLGQLLGLLE